jgi:hypothetical protein
MFLLGLHLAATMLDAPLPSEVMLRCKADKRLELLALNVTENLFKSPEHIPATPLEIFKYNIGVRKSVSARARYLVYMLRPTDGDIATHSLPTFAYYLTRPFRLMFRTGHQ